MGAAIIVPESDARMTRLIDLFRLTDYDIGMFYKIFNRLGTYNVSVRFTALDHIWWIITLINVVIKYIICWFFTRCVREIFLIHNTIMILQIWISFFSCRFRSIRIIANIFTVWEHRVHEEHVHRLLSRFTWYRLYRWWNQFFRILRHRSDLLHVWEKWDIQM